MAKPMEFIHCPNCFVPRLLARREGESNRCASCGEALGDGETELALEKAQEWTIVRAYEACGKELQELRVAYRNLLQRFYASEEWVNSEYASPVEPADEELDKEVNALALKHLGVGLEELLEGWREHWEE
jgi:hypothetical protein